MDFGEGVAGEFVEEGAGDFEGDDVFEYDGGGGDGTDIGAFVGGVVGLFGVEVDALEGFEEGSDGFHGAAYDDGLAVGDTAFDSAGVVGVADEAE